MNIVVLVLVVTLMMIFVRCALCTAHTWTKCSNAVYDFADLTNQYIFSCITVGRSIVGAVHMNSMHSAYH